MQDRGHAAAVPAGDHLAHRADVPGMPTDMDCGAEPRFSKTTDLQTTDG
jgi:hypothetical protein